MYDKPTRHSDLDYTNSATHFIKKKKTPAHRKNMACTLNGLGKGDTKYTFLISK
jgi:hypothetical protein